jgi:hypothetical protein
LKDILKEKRRGNFTKEFLVLEDKAPADRALATEKKLAYPGFRIWPRRTNTYSLN